MRIKLRVLSVLLFLLFVTAVLAAGLTEVLISGYLPTGLFLAMIPIIILAMYGLTVLHGNGQRALALRDVELDSFDHSDPAGYVPVDPNDLRLCLACCAVIRQGDEAMHDAAHQFRSWVGRRLGFVVTIRPRAAARLRVAAASAERQQP